MAEVLTDATIWYDALNLTSLTNKIELGATAAEVDATTFGSNGWEEKLGGLKKVTAVGEGFVDYADPDKTFFGDLGGTGKILTVTDGGTQSCRAFTSRNLLGSYMHGGTIGEMDKFTINLTGSSGPGLVAGYLLHPITTVTGNSNGSGLEFTAAIPAGSSGYGVIHCFTAGTTADVIIESAAASNFSGATTRLTSTITAVGSTWMTPVAGAVTDTWFRVRTATVTGTFSLAVFFGVQ